MVAWLVWSGLALRWYVRRRDDDDDDRQQQQSNAIFHIDEKKVDVE
jgi:hypothetical protein